MNILYVFLGGGIGASLRYLIQTLLGKHNGMSFPISTFLVNVLGCILIGVLAGLILKLKWNEHVILFVFTGLLGGFTTFSSFSLEFVQLLKNNQVGIAFLYVGLSNFVGLALCAFAYSLAIK
jgi:CrcB protein